MISIGIIDQASRGLFYWLLIVEKKASGEANRSVVYVLKANRANIVTTMLVIGKLHGIRHLPNA